MESAIYFFVGTSALMFMIMMFDVQQRRRVNKILKNTRDVQPLFLLRSTEEKLRQLNTILYGNMPTGINGVPSGRVTMNEGARQLMASQLGKLVSDYNARQVSLKFYNNKLGEMLQMVNQIKQMNFEQI